MVKLLKAVVERKGELRAELYADTKDEVTMITGAGIEGMDANEKLLAGSSVVTATFDAGILDSNGVWNWSE